MLQKWRRVANRDLIIGISVLALLVVTSHFKREVKPKIKAFEPQNWVKKITSQKVAIPQYTDFEPPRNGVMITNIRHERVPINEASFRQNRLILRRLWNQTVGIMAQGSNARFYYANGFFQDFVPFKVANVYNAMNFIAQRLRYQFDEKLFAGRKEIWQTSKEAYVRMRGDCEDHAILLADWLMSLGYDARVVVGTYKGGGHAWVVWFNKGEAYIIEATNKRKRRFYPLAGSMYEYQASYMFNKNSFWERSKKNITDDYQTGWDKRADFQPL